MDGSYNLHYFADNYWFQIVQEYLRLTTDGKLSTDLQDSLSLLLAERLNDKSFGKQESFVVPLQLTHLKTQCPDLYEFLINTAQFQERCSQNGYHISLGLFLSPKSRAIADNNRGKMAQSESSLYHLGWTKAV